MPSRLRSENRGARFLASWCWTCSLHRQITWRQGVTSPSAQVAFSLPCNAMKIFAICLRSSEFKRGHRPQSVVTILSMIPWLWSTSIITYTTQTKGVHQGLVHTLLFFSSLKAFLKSSEIRSFYFFSNLWWAVETGRSESHPVPVKRLMTKFHYLPWPGDPRPGDEAIWRRLHWESAPEPELTALWLAALRFVFWTTLLLKHTEAKQPRKLQPSTTSSDLHSMTRIGLQIMQKTAITSICDVRILKYNVTW